MNFETFASSILAIHIYYILCSTFYMQYKSEVPDDDKTTAGSTSRPPQTSGKVEEHEVHGAAFVLQFKDIPKLLK